MPEYVNKEPEVLHDIYGGKAFVKIKQCLEIGKMLFSFVNSQEGQTKEHVDCYISAEQFGLFCRDLSSGLLLRKLAEEKAKGEKYPKAVWFSPLGGSVVDGNAISRSFDLAPASIAGYDAVFTAKCIPAEKNAMGAFIPKKGARATITLRVPCSIEDLRLIAYKWSWLEKDYMSAKYSMEAMKPARSYNDNGSNNTASAATNNSTAPASTPTPAPAPTQKDNNVISMKNQQEAAAAKSEAANNAEKELELKSLSAVLSYGKSGYKCLKAITRQNKEIILLIPPESFNEFQVFCNSLKPGAIFKATLIPYKDKFLLKKVS